MRHASSSSQTRRSKLSRRSKRAMQFFLQRWRGRGKVVQGGGRRTGNHLFQKERECVCAIQLQIIRADADADADGKLGAGRWASCLGSKAETERQVS